MRQITGGADNYRRHASATLSIGSIVHPLP
jgi:hypothetical protein